MLNMCAAIIKTFFLPIFTFTHLFHNAAAKFEIF